MDKGGEGGSYRRKEVADDRSTPAEPPASASVRDFYNLLSREEKQLLLLRNELYGGSWEEMEQDLRRRLERKPYVFRLMNRIEEDLARIDRLRAYEETHHTDLGVFLTSGIDDR